MGESLQKALENGRASVLVGLEGLFHGVVSQGDESSDFKIVCGKQVWKVHRVVLQIHSKVLAAACNGKFKEGTERSLDLSREQPDCVAGMISYLYCLDYPPVETGHERIRPLEYHTKMCVLADQYDIEPLPRIAIAKFRVQMDKEYLNEELFNEDLAHAATCAYDAMQPTTEIRARIIKTAIELRLFSPDAEESTQNEFEKVARARPDLAVDIAAAVMKQLPEKQRTPTTDKHRYQCPRIFCSGTFFGILHPAKNYTCNACGSCFDSATWEKGKRD